MDSEFVVVGIVVNFVDDKKVGLSRRVISEVPEKVDEIIVVDVAVIVRLRLVILVREGELEKEVILLIDAVVEYVELAVVDLDFVELMLNVWRVFALGVV